MIKSKFLETEKKKKFNEALFLQKKNQGELSFEVSFLSPVPSISQN